MRARDIAYRRQHDEYQQAFDPMGQHTESRASLADARCTCEQFWAGIGQRPACVVHEIKEK